MAGRSFALHSRRVIKDCDPPPACRFAPPDREALHLAAALELLAGVVDDVAQERSKGHERESAHFPITSVAGLPVAYLSHATSSRVAGSSMPRSGAIAHALFPFTSPPAGAARSRRAFSAPL